MLFFFAGCGSRSALLPPEQDGVGGGGSPAEGGGGAVFGTSTSTATPVCDLEDLSSWKAEHFRDDGNYDRAAIAASGVPWVALKVHDGDIVLREISVSSETGILVARSFEIPDSPVYPVALDVSDARFALLTTTGINWNGDLELWSIDRKTLEILRVPVGAPPTDPGYTVATAIGVLGDDIALAYARLIDDVATIEIRNTALEVQVSAVVDGTLLRGVRAGASGLDVYSSATLRVHVEAGKITEHPVDPEWTVMGGLDDTLAQFGDEIRLVQGDTAWGGPWPHTQISPPAVIRFHDGHPAFSLETELTGVVGYPVGTELRWMDIEPSDEASGIGVALLPVVEENRLGLFYLGLDIPHPEQPLRYFGRVCP